MTPINTCTESQKWPHGPHASLNSIVAFHYCKTAAQETLSRKEKTAISFDDIESSVLSEEDDNILVGTLSVSVPFLSLSPLN